MAQNSRTSDLTTGPLLQKIILFALPLAASSILQLLFNAADVVVVGRFAGSTALAAVGSNGALINLLVNLFVGLSLGANVVAARCFGARDEKGVQDTVHTSVALGLVSGVFLAVVGFFAARVLLELMSCPEDVIDLSTLYLKIYFIGMPCTCCTTSARRCCARRATPSGRWSVWPRRASSTWCSTSSLSSASGSVLRAWRWPPSSADRLGLHGHPLADERTGLLSTSTLRRIGSTRGR